MRIYFWTKDDLVLYHSVHVHLCNIWHFTNQIYSNFYIISNVSYFIFIQPTTFSAYQFLFIMQQAYINA